MCGSFCVGVCVCGYCLCGSVGMCESGLGGSVGCRVCLCCVCGCVSECVVVCGVYVIYIDCDVVAVGVLVCMGGERCGMVDVLTGL